MARPTDFAIGDRVLWRNPHFPDKRPSRHVVTKIIDGAGPNGDGQMLLVDGAMGVNPEECERATVEYRFPSDPPQIEMSRERVDALRRYLAADTFAFSEARAARKKWAPTHSTYNVLHEVLREAEDALPPIAPCPNCLHVHYNERGACGAALGPRGKCGCKSKGPKL